MAVGRAAPRYQQMALLYPRPKSLQSQLSGYFVMVVRLCHQILKFAQKSAHGKLASSLSDSDLKAHQSELDLRANAIKEEVSLLTAKRFQEETQKNFEFRTLSNKFSQSMSRDRILQFNLRVLDSCSGYDYMTTWKQIRKVGTATA